MTKENKTQPTFTKYQVLLMVLLALVNFTIFLDFMIMAPLGPHLLESLSLSTSQFGYVMSAYAISAGVFSIVNAMFADKFERKRLLLFLYFGLIVSTVMCGLANSYEMLFAARMVAGVFGGSVGAMVQTFIADCFEPKKRGRVMGLVFLAIGITQVGGLPLGLYLADKFDWHAPFLFVAAFGTVVLVVLALKLKPITEHLALQTKEAAYKTLWRVMRVPAYLKAYTATLLVMVSGWLMMPYSPSFLVFNVGIDEGDLPTIYLFMGIAALIAMPLVGKIADKIGRMKVLTFGIILSTIMVVIYVNLPVSPLITVIVVNVIFFAGISMRMVPFNAMIASVPEQKERGAFMSINASLQQLSGGIAALVGGQITYQAVDKQIVNFDVLGYITIGVSLLLWWTARRVHKGLKPEEKINPELIEETKEPEFAS